MKSILSVLLASCCSVLVSTPPLGAADQPIGDLPYAVCFELGEAEFAPGDSITIQAVRGNETNITLGGTYCVTGTYTLSSRTEADLALFVTTTNTTASAVDPQQTLRIQKGSGNFVLVKKMEEAGYPHLSFYPIPSGSAFGGIYFGQGVWTLHHKGFSYLNSSPPVQEPQVSPDQSSANSDTMPAQNRRILNYLGSPVAPPANLDPAYTREGLLSAMRLAAQQAGIALRRLEIDETEFPFLVGIVCAEGDYPKMLEQIKKMPAYEEQGGVSSKTCRAINVIPWRAFPGDASERIGRRMILRERMLYDQLSRQK